MNNMTAKSTRRGVTIGTFDGMHRGHQEVVATLRHICEERGLKPLVMTFDRHPISVIAPERTPRMLTSHEEKLRRIERCGMEHHTLIFTAGLAAVSARAWMRRLREEFDAEVLVIGYDNTFGCDGRSLGPDDYIRIGAEEDLEVVVAPVLSGISSSAIRKAVSSGDIAAANEMLGTPFMIEGIVEHGKALGRTLGFPTANISIEEGLAILPSGVYAAEVEIEDTKETYPAVVNIGVRPTVEDDGRMMIEAHLLDFSGNIYGKKARIRFMSFIRPEQKFDSLESLKDRIAEDIIVCREREVKSKTPVKERIK